MKGEERGGEEKGEEEYLSNGYLLKKWLCSQSSACASSRDCGGMRRWVDDEGGTGRGGMGWSGDEVRLRVWMGIGRRRLGWG